MSSVVNSLSPSDYLRAILKREAVDESATSPGRAMEGTVLKLCTGWAGRHLNGLYASGAIEKGMANASSTRIDFVVSLRPDAPFPIENLYTSLFATLERQRYFPVRRPVSIGVTIAGTFLDLIPARRETMSSDSHEIYSTRSGRVLKTDLTQHVLDAMAMGARDEVRILKLWRDQNGLEFPSFYLELSTYAALRRKPAGTLADNVWEVLGYLATHLVARGILDPANAANIVSEELTTAEKRDIAAAAQDARSGRPWSEIVW